MKKITKILALALLVVLCLTALTACSNISQAYADKINKAAEKDKPLTYSEVLEDLGDNAIDIVVPIINTGVIIAAQGCESLEELNAKLEEGKQVKGIVVTIAGGEAVKAEYKVLTKEDTSK